ncbi:HAD-IA family hydrolase [Fodinicurvata fenggangensis]|uniref:HAD-IA family hydrolase n=1 Tax=Fodinicurvata fenggangensis TaxID=1121830 RepID=UPI000556727A|nr:HAD-IA family hydrolase [Fodinicurvata fenggangensis]
MKQNAYTVLLLDLDGTLVDSAPGLTEALAQLLSEQNLPAPSLSEVIPMVGDGARKLVEKALIWAEADPPPDLDTATARFLHLYANTLIADTKLYESVNETLLSLSDQGWRMAVCTNKPEAPSRTILENLGLAHLFEQIAGGDSYPARKPDPRHLTDCLKAMGASPREAVMIGDGHNDLLAGQSAGLATIWADYGYGGDRAAALPRDGVISAFSELPESLRQLQARCSA